jgi:hypothetical protein
VTAKQIRDTAEGLAGAYWDDMFSRRGSERFKHFWPVQKVFIKRNWVSFGEMALAILTDMLRRSDAEVPPVMKAQIYEALQQNAAEAAKRRPEKVGRGPMMLRPDRPGTMEQHLFWRK